MSTATMISASKVVWGLYKGLIKNGGPWFNIEMLHKISLSHEEYFTKKYPHQVAVVGWNDNHKEWINDHIEDSNWDWMPLGSQRYLFGFSSLEDAILFKTTWS